jgi:hypothetical protein
MINMNKINFDEINENIKSFSFDTNKIIFEYDKFKIVLTFTQDCCETSWFELVKRKNIKIANNYIPFNSINGKQIKNIISLQINTLYNNIPKSNIDEFDENKLFKINFTDESYTYFLLRCSSNGYYSTYLEIKKYN